MWAEVSEIPAPSLTYDIQRMRNITKSFWTCFPHLLKWSHQSQRVFWELWLRVWEMMRTFWWEVQWNITQSSRLFSICCCHFTRGQNWVTGSWMSCYCPMLKLFNSVGHWVFSALAFAVEVKVNISIYIELTHHFPLMLIRGRKKTPNGKYLIKFMGFHFLKN